MNIFRFPKQTIFLSVTIFLLILVAKYISKLPSAQTIYEQNNDGDDSVLKSNTKNHKYFSRRSKSLSSILHPYQNETKYGPGNLLNDSTDPSDCLKPSSNELAWSIHPKPCHGNIFIIWIIKSSIYRNSLRQNIRDYWGQDTSFKINNKKYKTRRLFILGSDAQNNPIPSINFENEEYDDILQGTFPDTFKSVTQKVVLGMQFVKQHCSSANYIAVVDDDTIIIPWYLFQHLPSVEQLIDGHFFGGFFIHGKSPFRNKAHRWYVPESDYHCTKYPPFPLGSGYFMTEQTMELFYESAIGLHLFGMDDVLFGGLAQELNVTITKFSFVHYSECGSLNRAHSLKNIKDLVMCHGTDYPHEQNLVWAEFCHNPISDPNLADHNAQYCKNYW